MKPTAILYSAIILIAMVALPISPALGHLCYPRDVKLKANSSVIWASEGEHFADFSIEDHGNSSIATIELVRVESDTNAEFKITAVAPGETLFRVKATGSGVPICDINVEVIHE